ncbi:MAG TPA: hypothetical protein VI796_01785 [Candidatus Thermoplasmatota archaeon]|nr:hypothetical protein [Candidatus Thermoplasmatota archaeon]
MDVPAFLLRKLYRKGSLRDLGDGRFAFALQNPLGDATLVAPPVIVVNGVHYPPERIESPRVELAAISYKKPYAFRRGDHITLRFRGHLLRGGNRIHVQAATKEWGDLDIYVEDRPADGVVEDGDDG